MGKDLHIPKETPEYLDINLEPISTDRSHSGQTIRRRCSHGLRSFTNIDIPFVGVSSLAKDSVTRRVMQRMCVVIVLLNALLFVENRELRNSDASMHQSPRREELVVSLYD